MQMEIFKTGTHTDGNGNTREWTDSDLNKIANSYNPQAHEAPVVIGHPKDNAPAYGWVEALEHVPASSKQGKKGGVLYAKVKDLVPEFVDAVKKGLYKKRSISLYPDMSLRHIGFLGAVPPAVKGLADVAFKDEGGITIEIGKEERNMKFLEWLKGLAAKEGVTLEDAPVSFSEAEIQQKIASAITEKEKEFSEKVASIEEARKKKEAELKAREDTLKASEVEAKKKEAANFCEGLLKEGKLTPAMLKHGMGLQNFLEQVGSIETVIEFGEGEKKEKQSPAEFMKSFLSNLPKAIIFGEAAGRDKDAGAAGDEEKREKFVSDYMEKNQDCTYKDAVLVISKENPDLFRGE